LLSSRSSLCSRIDAICAFAWICWVIWTCLLIFLLVIGVRQSTHGNKDVWLEPVPTYTQGPGAPFAPGGGPVAPGTALGAGPSYVGSPVTQQQPGTQQVMTERV
jgi:hypothetical protein